MLELETQKYLRDGNTLDDLKTKYGIRHNRSYDNLVILNYSQIDSPKTNPLVMECRGLILEADTWNLVSIPFYRFFNYGEATDIVNFNFDDAVLQEKIDGSLIQLFYYNNRWRMATRAVIDGDNTASFGGIKFKDVDSLINYVKKNSNILTVDLKTSGTTGESKKITQKLSNLIRHVKKTDVDLVWGFCYSPIHIAGIQVLLQIILNKNTLVYLFEKDFTEIENEIYTKKVTNISCTPTFMKMLLPKLKRDYELSKVTFGGERLNDYLVDKLVEVVPGVKVRNVYASTEAGSILASKGEYFRIPEHLLDSVKIENNEICIHKSLLGLYDLKSEWFKTGDFIEYVNDVEFKIVARDSEIIKTAGYRVSLSKVENILQKEDNIEDCVVYTRNNSIIGKIICVDIVTETDIKGIKNIIKKITSLENYEKPQVINIVQSLKLTQTGKVSRV